MTIKELCKKYNCDKTGIYKKIKRKRAELNGHIFIEKGIVQIDNVAESILKPKDNHNKINDLIEKGQSAEWEIERAKNKYKYEASKRIEAEEQIEVYKSEILEKDALIESLLKEKEEYLFIISDLKRRIEDLEQKPRGIFGKR